MSWFLEEIKNYRKKPVVIQALRFDGHNVGQIQRFCSAAVADIRGMEVVIHTLEGDMRITDGDYIIKGIKGEFYPCKPDIFEASYEETL